MTAEQGIKKLMNDFDELNNSTKKEEDVYIDESSEYSPKSEYSKPSLLFEASQRCLYARGVEMRRGFFNVNVSKEGLPIKVYIPDTRLAYISAVDALYNFLYPEILEDPKWDTPNILQKWSKKEKEIGMKDHKTFEERKKEIIKRYAYYEFDPIISKGKIVDYKKSETNYRIPSLDEPLLAKCITRTSQGDKMSLEHKPKLWNQKVHAYYDELVIYYDSLLRALNRVIHRKGYFKSGVQW